MSTEGRDNDSFLVVTDSAISFLQTIEIFGRTINKDPISKSVLSIIILFTAGTLMPVVGFIVLPLCAETVLMDLVDGSGFFFLTP